MDNKDTRDICWQLFTQTGEISYYMLYKAMKEDGRNQDNSNSIIKH